MDEIFNAAYKGFSENPSSNVWDKISSGLDKVEASSYKRRLRRWKQVAIFSLLLLAGFVLYETILKNHDIYVYPRPNSIGGDLAEHPKVKMTQAPLIEISSTAIRNAIKEKKDMRHFVPATVWEYLTEMHFYRK